jgi:uncharacterized membrane protein YadS
VQKTKKGETKMIRKIIILLILLSTIVIATNNTPQEQIQQPTIVPIYIGEYFTGNIYIKQEGQPTQWCSYIPKLNKYNCKEFGK